MHVSRRSSSSSGGRRYGRTTTGAAAAIHVLIRAVVVVVLVAVEVALLSPSESWVTLPDWPHLCLSLGVTSAADGTKASLPSGRDARQPCLSYVCRSLLISNSEYFYFLLLHYPLELVLLPFSRLIF